MPLSIFTRCRDRTTRTCAETRRSSAGGVLLADATAYLTLFITVSGIYLWVALKAERRVGIVLVLAGAITFWGLVYAVAA